jgi:hypothetical protein
MLLVSFYIILFIVLIYVLPFFKENTIHRGAVSVVFAIKIAAGFFLTWIYTSYYPERQAADIFKYFDDSKIIYSAVENHKYLDYFKMLTGIVNDNVYFDETYYNKMNHWYRMYDFNYNDNHTIIRFNAFVMLFSFGNFNVHTVFMCFTALLGLTAMYKAFVGYFKGKENLLFLALFLIPSVVFWGSGVLKEGILLFALGFLFYSFVNVFINRKSIVLNLILLLFSVFLIMINKNYLLFAVLPALLCFYVAEKFNIKRVFVFFSTAYVLGCVAILIFSPDILQTLALKQRDFIAVAKGGAYMQNREHMIRIAPDKKIFLDTLTPKTFRIKQGSAYLCWKNGSPSDTIYVTNSKDTATFNLLWDLPEAGSTINVAKLEPGFFSLLKTIPSALYNSLCKPGLFSARSILEKMAAAENIFALLFLIACIWFRKKEFNKNLLALCVFICLAILLLIGYTTPIAGAIMRYKVPVMPFLLMCGIIVLDEKRLKFFSEFSRS